MDSTITLHATQQSHNVKILDKSKRAYDCSIESTRALEMAVHKDDRSCSTCPTRFKSVVYSLWIMLLKYHGKAPEGWLNFWFLMFSMSLAIEFMLTTLFLLHIANPISNIQGFGFPFLCILPGLPVFAPFWGLIATMLGSVEMLKSYSSMNSTMMLVNYPITLIFLIVQRDHPLYVAILCLMILNKFTLSYFGSKVR